MKRLPTRIGVYVVRRTTAAPCVRGESDIVYVGSACNQRGLKGRLNQYFSPGPSQFTNQRILELVGESEEYEVGWYVVNLKSEAVGMEQRILERFVAEHDQRPPANRKG